MDDLENEFLEGLNNVRGLSVEWRNCLKTWRHQTSQYPEEPDETTGGPEHGYGTRRQQGCPPENVEWREQINRQAQHQLQREPVYPSGQTQAHGNEYPDVPTIYRQPQPGLGPMPDRGPVTAGKNIWFSYHCSSF